MYSIIGYTDLKNKPMNSETFESDYAIHKPGNTKNKSLYIIYKKGEKEMPRTDASMQSSLNCLRVRVILRHFPIHLI